MFDRQTSFAIVFCGLLFVWAARVGAEETEGDQSGTAKPTVDAAKALEQEMLVAAKEAYEASARDFANGTLQSADEPYRWSRRWMDAGITTVQSEHLWHKRIIVAEAHVKRMAALQEIVETRMRAGTASEGSAAAIKFYRTEADLLVQQVRAMPAPAAPMEYRPLPLPHGPVSPYAAPINPYSPYSQDGQSIQPAPRVPDGTLYGGARIILLSVGRTY